MAAQGVLTAVPFVTPTGEYQLASLDHKEIVVDTPDNGWRRLVLYLCLGHAIGVYEDEVHRFTLQAHSEEEVVAQVKLACDVFCAGGFHARAFE